MPEGEQEVSNQAEGISRGGRGNSLKEVSACDSVMCGLRYYPSPDQTNGYVVVTDVVVLPYACVPASNQTQACAYQATLVRGGGRHMLTCRASYGVAN